MTDSMGITAYVDTGPAEMEAARAVVAQARATGQIPGAPDSFEKMPEQGPLRVAKASIEDDSKPSGGFWGGAALYVGYTIPALGQAIAGGGSGPIRPGAVWGLLNGVHAYADFKEGDWLEGTVNSGLAVLSVSPQIAGGLVRNVSAIPASVSWAGRAVASGLPVIGVVYNLGVGGLEALYAKDAAGAGCSIAGGTLGAVTSLVLTPGTVLTWGAGTPWAGLAAESMRRGSKALCLVAFGKREDAGTAIAGKTGEALKTIYNRAADEGVESQEVDLLANTIPIPDVILNDGQGIKAARITTAFSGAVAESVESEAEPDQGMALNYGAPRASEMAIEV